MPTSRRILVIENDDATRDMFQFMLQYVGYCPVLQSGPSPEEDPQTLDADLIILDWSVHNETAARAFLNRLHASCSTSTIPVIVCTTTPLEHMQHYEEVANTPILHKPFQVDDLLATISRYSM